MLSDKAGNRLYKYVPNYVVFDLETTGISPYNDEVVEISGIKVTDGTIVDEFSSLVNPGRPIPWAASSVNGITDDMVKDSPTFEEVFEQFLLWAGDFILVGHNIHSFDMKFLYRDAERYWNKTLDNDYVDTLTFARQVLPELSHHRLVDLAVHYGISPEGAHRALADCRMNQRVFELLAKDLNNNHEIKTCPKCNQMLKKRNGRFGEFWGCMSYPNCKYTENIK